MTLTIDNEFKNLIPPLTPDERKGLEESILSEGCRDALIAWNGVLVDGHNRYEICEKYGLPFSVTETDFESRDAVIEWIIKNQFGRRNLPLYERARLALRLKPVIAERAKENNRLGADMTNTGLQNSVKAVNTQQEIAKAAGVSHDTIAKVEKIEASASDKTKEALRRGDISINQAYTEIKKQEKAETRAARKAFTLEDEMPEDMCRLYNADIRDGLPIVKTESVDCIITDPPYPREYIPLYGDLSRLAARVLKPGGSLIVMCGQSYLPEVMKELCTAMKYHWTCAYLTPGGQSPQLFHKCVNTFWKPLLWFTKGEYGGNWIGDVLKSPPNDNDKQYHVWGQSFYGTREIVERFTNPDDLVLDPFLGGGTTGAAAVTLRRRFIGSDIEQKNIDTARDRITEAYIDARSKT